MAESFEAIDLLLDYKHEGSLSGQLLYKFFCNNIRLGQWELARACIETLLRKDGKYGKPISELLKDIIEEPLAYCDGSPSVPTPFHLSWLCLLEFLKHYEGKVALPECIQEKIEFRLLLQSCNPQNISIQCLQELDHYHTKVVVKNHGAFSQKVPNISSSWLKPLNNLVRKQPQVAHAIIRQLLGCGEEFADNNAFFQSLYLDLIREHLTRSAELDTSVRRISEHNDPGEHEQSMLEAHKLCCDTIHQLLVAMDPRSDIIEPEVDELLMNLLHRVQSSTLQRLSKGTIYSALLAHSSDYLFQKFCDIENDWQLGVCCSSSVELTPFSRMFLPSETLLIRSCGKPRPDAWKLFYFYARRNNHILEDVVKSCVEFVRQRDYDKVAEILSCVEFSPMKALVLLLAWPFCHSCDSAQKLLDILWDPNSPSKHVLLDQACAKLEYQVHLVKWCMDKTKPLIAASDTPAEDHRRVYEMFQGLDSHSVLHVLHHSTNLALLPEQEVVEMLRTRPVFNSTSCASQREKSSEDPEDSETSFNEGDEIQRDVALYHGFCALRGFMEAILCGRSDEEESGTDVAAKMQEAHDHLTSIFPLTFRVEVLENVFSLLFVSTEHLLDDVSQAVESDDLETLDSRSLRSSHTGSFESLVSIDSRNTSPWRPFRTSDPVSGPEPSGSCTASPESFKSLDVENFMESQTGCRATDRSSTNFVLEERLAQEPDPYTEKMSAEDKTKQEIGSLRARELQFDDVGVKNMEGGVPREEFPPLVIGSGKGKLLELCERKVKGLLVNKTVVSQMLELLKKCLNDVISLKSDQKECDEYKVHADWIKTSVTMTTLEQRISRLGQYINEAQWRHQLVSTCCHGYESDDETTEDLSNFSSDGDSEVEQDSNGEVKSVDDLKKPRKRRTNLTKERMLSKRSPSTPQQDTSITRLLSSPSSLIYLCMKTDNYEQAKHIIKLFNVNDDKSSKAVLFAEEYEKAFQKLALLEKNKSKEKTATPANKGRLSALKTIASAAAAGIASISPTSVVEELLLSSSIDLKSSGLIVTEPAHAHFVTALVCVDFLCTGHMSRRSCQNLLEMARMKINLGMEIEPSSPYALGRISEFLENLQSLLTDDRKALTAVDTILGNTEPLNAKTVKREEELLVQQYTAFDKLEEAIENGDTVIKSVAENPGAKMPAVIKFKKMERRTAVRVAMIEFQNAFDCTRNTRLTDVRRSKLLPKCRFDYVESLFVHVNMLSAWELYWKMNSTDRSTIQLEKQTPITLKATNPFLVLTQGFDDLAGKPLFERNVPPKRMESMCQKMNVNLIQIIVHNCCPVIPAFGSSERNGPPLSSSTKVALNGHINDEMIETDDLVLFAEMLLTKMKELLEGMQDPDTGIVDLQSLVVLSSSPSYCALLQEIRKLCWVDLNELTSEDEKICFFTNILNVLLTHSAITEISRCSTRYNKPSGNMSDSGTEDHSSAINSWKCRLPRFDTAYCRTAYLKKYGYNIGQLGFISAFDLWFTVLRAGLDPPAIAQNLSIRSQASHRYQKYQPKKSDFRLTFLICDGTISAPEMQVLRRDDLHSQLEDALSNYLLKNVTMDIEDEKIVLPELLKWYYKDITSVVRPPSDQQDSRRFTDHETWTELLLRISPYLRGDQFKNFDDIAPQLTVTFQPHHWHFGYTFENSNVFSERYLLVNHKSARSSNAAQNGPKYTLTKGLSNYLMAQSPLVASLANLSCAQGSSKGRTDKHNASDADFPSLLSGGTNSGTHSLEIASPFEFAINRTAKFPFLQRHITSGFYSVLKFLYLGGLGLVQSVSQRCTSFGTDLSDRDQSRLFLLDESSPEVSDVFLRAVNYAWCKADWELLLEIFNSANLKEQGRLGDPEDFVLEMAFQSAAVTKQDDDISAQAASTLRTFNIPAPNFDLNWKQNPWLLLYRVKNNYLRASIVLQCLHNWADVTVCLDLLNFCCSKPPRDPELLAALQRKTKQLSLCQKVIRSHNSRSSDVSRTFYENWKDVVEQSVRAPESVVQALLDDDEFDLVWEWMEIYAYSTELRQKIHEVYLQHLFKKKPVDITKAYMYLEEIKDPSEMLLVCERLLSKSMAIPNVVFLIHFMTTELDNVLIPERKRELLRQRLGANALLCIPESNRLPYVSLVSQPLLLLEQLLMDMKVEWAAKVFNDLQNELSTSTSYDESHRKEVSVDAFEKLLIVYAKKALEFEVVSYQQTSNSSSESTNRKQSRSLDFRQVRSSTPVRKHERHASSGTLPSSGRSSGNNSGLSADDFKIPDQIPPEDQWEPDYKHSVCMICKDVTFNMFIRRHHCRRCGRVVCDSCSPFKRVLEYYGGTPVRVCRDCDKMMYEESHKPVNRNHLTGSLPTYLNKNMESQVSASLGDGRFGSAVWKSEDEFNFNGHNGWKLTLSEECNAIIREDFLYEQAPSSSLCTSILSLHSNRKTCAKLLLELCNKLSQKLGLSEEIDHNLLISIICQLLLHAKLNFTNCGETQGVELCDTYMSRVELVKFLIESNFYDVPSIEDLMSSQTARRLRDRLIENESLSLAMEVTTKCALDPAAVWGAWGLAYLQVGKFKEAREKFGKFLKPSDRGKAAQGNIRYLQMIIDILETSPMISFDYLTVGDLDASLASLREHAKNSGGDRNLDPKRFEECIFYLNKYGSYSGVVSFYSNHNQMKTACRFILEKRCSPEIFTESLLMPAIRSGQFELLRDLLKKFDPSLEIWIPHMSGACRYLSRYDWLNALYQVQLLMKDYFRASMTCIKFYQGLPHYTATTYSQLHSRSHYLQDAKAHLDAVRRHQHSRKGTIAMVKNSLQQNLGETSEDKMRMSVTPTELTNHLNAVMLQMEVTKFMHNCYLEGTLRQPKENTRRLGTLFDNANTKRDVVAEVLLAGSTVVDGFSLSCRIIQDFRLPALAICKTVAEKLFIRQKFNEIQVLLTNACQTRLINDKDHDGVVLGVLSTMAEDERKWKQAETLIKLLKDEGKKIAAYIRFGRLRTAYLIAVAGDRVEDVRTIARVAKQTEQTKVYDICTKWLASNEKKRERHVVFPTGDWEGV